MYNQQVESYGAFPPFARLSHSLPGYTTPEGWLQFSDVYSDIADVTPLDESFRATGLVGKIDCIKRLSTRTQREIISVVLRDAGKLEAPAHRIVRVRHGWYQWDFSQDPEAHNDGGSK